MIGIPASQQINNINVPLTNPLTAPPIINDKDNFVIDIKEYYKEKSIIPKRNMNVNEIDNKLHIESIKEIPKSIWKKLEN